MTNAPIFIAGPDRSGTTLMFALLASHPNLSMVRRTNMWRYFHGRYGPLSDPANFEQCLDHMVRYNRMRHLNPDPVRIRHEFWQGEPSYGRLFALFHEHHMQRAGKTRWGDKSLHTELFADALFAEFPDARLLHMARDPRDRYASVRKRYGRDNRRVGAATGRWLKSMRAAETNLQRYPANYKIVHFERLAAHPEETLQEICAFIGEQFTPSMLRMEGAAEHREQGGNSSFAPLQPGTISTKPIGRFRTVLDGPEIAFIQQVARPEMTHLGYQPEPIHWTASERARYLAWDFPFSLARMLGWLTLFNLRLKRGIRVPPARLRDIQIPPAQIQQA